MRKASLAEEDQVGNRPRFYPTHGVGRRVGYGRPGVRQPHRRLDVADEHAAVIARGITGRSVVDDSAVATPDGGHCGPRCPRAGAGAAAVVTRKADDYRGLLSTAADPWP